MPIISKALQTVEKAGPRASQSNPSFIGSSMHGYGSYGIGGHDNLSLYQGWTWACVNTIATALSGLEAEVSAFDPVAKERVPAEEHHWLVDLINNPNPEFGKTEIWDLASRWFLINGNAYIYAPTYGEALPQELWVLPSNRVTVVPGTPESGKFILGYVFYHEGGRQFIDAEEIVHWKFLDPSRDTNSTLYTGRSPINAARTAIQVDVSNQNYLESFYRNGALPAFVVTVANEMTPHQFDLFKERWNQTFMGPQGAGKWAVLDEGKDIRVLSSSDQTEKSALLDESNRKRVCSVWGVPEMLITGDYNARAVSENVTVNFHRDNVAPKAKRLAESLTRMARRYDTATDPTVTFLPYTYTDPTEVRAERESWHKMGVPLNQLRLEEGFEPIPEEETAPSELRSTVGGVTSLTQLQVYYSTGQMLREAAIASAVLVYEFTRKEAERLFPPLDGTPLEEPPTDEDESTGDVETFLLDTEEIRYAKALPEEVKAAYWKRYDDPAEELKDTLAETIGAAYREIGKDVIAEFRRQNPDGDKAVRKDFNFSGEVFSLDDVKELLEDLSEEELREFIVMAGERAIDDAGSNPRYREPYGKRVDDLVKRSTSKITTSADTLKAQLEELLRKNRRSTVDEVVAKIQARFDHYTEGGARTIARTTATFATGAAQMEAWNVLELNDPTIQSIERVWLTQHDSKVRDTHVDADGQIADAQGNFIVGGAIMRHPGDGNDAGEAANCRCVTRPRIKRDPNATDPNNPDNPDTFDNPDDIDPLDMFALGQL